jgi:hypothetical protein
MRNTPERTTADEFIGKPEKKLHLLNVNARTKANHLKRDATDVMRYHRIQLAKRCLHLFVSTKAEGTVVSVVTLVACEGLVSRQELAYERVESCAENSTR